MPTTTKRSGHPTVPTAARFVFPDFDRVPAQPVAVAEPAVLTFDEDELARAMGASAASTGKAVQSTMRADRERELQQTCGRLLEALQLAQRRQCHLAETMKIEVRRVVAVFADVCLAQVAGVAMAEAMVHALERVVGQIPSAAPVTVEIAPGLIEPVAALLAAHVESAASGSLALKARSDLADGDVVVSWPDGWADWSLDRLRSQLATELGQLPASPDHPIPAALAEPSILATDQLSRITEDAD